MAVHQGGGLCSLSNLQTLCTVCHARKTDRQNRERKQGIVAAKQSGAPVLGSKKRKLKQAGLQLSETKQAGKLIRQRGSVLRKHRNASLQHIHLEA